MTASNHLYVGAAIGLAVKQPLLALPLAAVSHFVLDALPHYGVRGGGYIEFFKHRLSFIAESINILAVPLLVYLIWGQNWQVWAAAVLALSPDFMWPYHYFWFERKGLQPPVGLITRFHHKIQWCERKWCIVVEFPFLAGMMYIVASLTA